MPITLPWDESRVRIWIAGFQPAPEHGEVGGEPSRPFVPNRAGLLASAGLFFAGRLGSEHVPMRCLRSSDDEVSIGVRSPRTISDESDRRGEQVRYGHGLEAQAPRIPSPQSAEELDHHLLQAAIRFGGRGV